MEITAQMSFSSSKLPVLPPTFHSKPSLIPFNNSISTPFHSPNFLQINIIKPKKHNNFGILLAASTSKSTISNIQYRWLLQPVGDGDWRHIGYKVKLPDAFEISSNAVTVGRVPDKADMVIPVATVSGIHARIETKGENLLVTDLDSTNGTFINEKRLKPGVVAAVSSGNFITFGDQNLAIFRVSKIVNVVGDSQDKEEEEEITITSETETTPTTN
ncbi:SMAD/FHA domain-containing protein [Euphorbia peplus]|nr:SMAD/FHA domain-containing protein [Euphorbia peplus]